jgi:cobalt-zinc-cadmium efflux system membrane fusion protein
VNMRFVAVLTRSRVVDGPRTARARFLRRACWLFTAYVWLLALTLVRAEDKKPAAVGTASGIELPAQSAKFVEIAAIALQTNQAWGRAIPARVSLQTSARINLGALVEGRVEEVLVRPGEKVTAGTPLLRIQSTGAGQSRADAEQAAARLEAAEESLRRYTTMLARGVGTELERFDAEIRAREARIDAERTRRAGSFLGSGSGGQVFVLAPTNGVVLTVGAALGAVLKAGDDGIMEIGDPSRVWIEAEVSEDDAARVRCGQDAVIESLRTGQSAEGKVEVLTAHVDPTTRRRRLYLSPTGERGAWLTPGLPVEVRLAEPPDQLVLPVEAVLIKDGERRIVYVQESDGRLHPRQIHVHPATGGRVRVVNGLTPGERVVVKGALLVDGRSEQLL